MHEILPGGLRLIDLLGIALIAGCAVLGAWRGLWWQVVSVLGLFSALALARAVAPGMALGLCDWIEGFDPRLALGLSWLVWIALGLFAVALVGRLGAASIEAVHLRPLDRLGGALAGGVAGLLLHGVIVLAIALLGPERWSHTTLAASRSEETFAPLSPGMDGVHAAPPPADAPRVR